MMVLKLDYSLLAEKEAEEEAETEAEAKVEGLLKKSLRNTCFSAKLRLFLATRYRVATGMRSPLNKKHGFDMNSTTVI